MYGPYQGLCIGCMSLPPTRTIEVAQLAAFSFQVDLGVELNRLLLDYGYSGSIW